MLSRTASWVTPKCNSGFRNGLRSNVGRISDCKSRRRR
jgi:hypothetical protein